MFCGCDFVRQQAKEVVGAYEREYLKRNTVYIPYMRKGGTYNRSNICSIRSLLLDGFTMGLIIGILRYGRFYTIIIIIIIIIIVIVIIMVIIIIMIIIIIIIITIVIIIIIIVMIIIIMIIIIIIIIIIIVLI